MSDGEALPIVGDYLWDRIYARTVDRLSSERYLIAVEILMENAGKALADVVLEGGVDDEPIVVLAGSGNNGGDALVAARYLAQAGAAVHVYTVACRPDGKPSPLYERQLKILAALGQSVATYTPGALTLFHKHEPIIIDGVFGIGFAGEMDNDSLPHKALTEAAALQDATVFAIDVPSGLDCDSGDMQSIPLTADITVTFGGKKPAHVLAPARDLCGDIVVADIGFPQQAQDAALNVHKPGLMQPDPRTLLRLDPWAELPRSAHKYDRGHVLIIGGSAGKTGAPLLAALACLRAGAGWVTVAMPQSALDTLKGDVPREITFEALFDGDQLNPINLQHFLDERKVKAVVCGPGFMANGLDPESVAVLIDFTHAGGFVVLDAGATQGVALLLEGLTELKPEPERWVLTPHPGEWRKLGPSFDVPPLTPSGLTIARERAERMGVCLLFKGATPVLITGNPGAPGFVTTEGTLAMARAGSGDVLAGVMGAHGAAGLTSAAAALRSQVVVAWAAELAAESKGDHAVVANDVIEHIGLVATLLAHEDEDDE